MIFLLNLWICCSDECCKTTTPRLHGAGRGRGGGCGTIASTLYRIHIDARDREPGTLDIIDGRADRLPQRFGLAMEIEIDRWTFAVGRRVVATGREEGVDDGNRQLLDPREGKREVVDPGGDLAHRYAPLPCVHRSTTRRKSLACASGTRGVE